MIESLRAEAQRRGMTVWAVRNERRFIEQRENGGARNLVMSYAGEFPGREMVCPYDGRALDSRRYPSLVQAYLDCALCCTTWSVGGVPMKGTIIGGVPKPPCGCGPDGSTCSVYVSGHVR